MGSDLSTIQQDLSELPALDLGSIYVMDNQLFREANRYLYNKNPGSALPLYTRILVQVSRGHPVALLNRSLCHIALNNPELAVMDAHSAYLAITLASDNDARFRIVSFAQNILDYTHLCEEATDESWIGTPAYMLEIPGSDHPASMANISLSAEKPDQALPDKVLSPVDLNDAKLKALYRLVYGLWKCSHGALSTALSLLDRLTLETKSQVEIPTAYSAGHILLSSDIAQEFKAIQHAIWSEIEPHFLPGQDRDIRNLIHAPGGLFATQHAIMNFAKWAAPTITETNKAILALDFRAAISLVPSSGGQKSVVSTRDMLNGDILFTEERIFNVSTTDKLPPSRYRHHPSTSSKHPQVPKPHIQELMSLLLYRVLLRSRASSEHPRDIPQITLLSSRHLSPSNSEEEDGCTAWSYNSHVILPLQLTEILSGDLSTLETRFGLHNSNGLVTNTLLMLLERGLHVKKKVNNNPSSAPSSSSSSSSSSAIIETQYTAQLLPLCDILPVDPDEVNARLVDLGDDRIVCVAMRRRGKRATSLLPLLPITLLLLSETVDDVVEKEQSESEVVIKKNMQIFLATRKIYPATAEEMVRYRREETLLYSDSDAESGEWV